MTQSTSVSSQQRFTRRNPCPICDSHANAKQGQGTRCYGYFSEDGEYANCTRSDFAGNLEERSDRTYGHKFYGECKCGVQHNPARANTSLNGHHKATSQKNEEDIFRYDDPRATAYFPYYDEHGSLLYTAVRYEWPDKDKPKGHSKTIRQFHKENGTWKPGIAGIRRVLYRLPDVLKADKIQTTLYIVEGENKVEALRKLGLLATCNPMGAKKWQTEYNESLKGWKNVVILPDNDSDGYEHAKQVFNALQSSAITVREVKLPDLPEKGDVIDWLAAGGTREKLEEVSQPLKRKFLYASEVKPEPVDWHWTKRLARGMFTLLAGDPGLGKGLLCATIAAETTNGSRLPDSKAAQPGGVIIMSPEDSYQHTIVPRLIAAGADLSKIILLSEVPDFDKDGNQYNRAVSFPEDASILEEAIIECKASLAIIDPVLAMVNGKYDAHKDQEARLALGRVLSVAERQQCAVLGIFHLNKSQSGNVLYRSGASIAWIAMARVGLFLVPDPDDPENGRVLVNHKNNLAAKATSLCFTIEQTQDEIGYIKWNGESPYSEQELLNQSTPTDNRKSEQETDLIEVLKKNGIAMTTADIHEQLHTDQSLNALEVMLKRKLEQGILIRPSRGLYTYNGNPLYTAKTKSEETDVSNVSSVSNVSDVSNVSFETDSQNLHLNGNVSFENASNGTSQADSDETYKTYIDSYVSSEEIPICPDCKTIIGVGWDGEHWIHYTCKRFLS